MAAPDAPRNQFGNVSVILGVSALITCWALIGVPLGIAAVVTADIGRGKIKRGEANNPRITWIGTVLGAIAIVAGIGFVGYYAWQDSLQPDQPRQCLVNGRYTNC